MSCGKGMPWSRGKQGKISSKVSETRQCKVGPRPSLVSVCTCKKEKRGNAPKTVERGIVDPSRIIAQ